jgi:hypothetical protein
MQDEDAGEDLKRHGNRIWQRQRGIYRKETGWTENSGKLWEPEGIEGCCKPDDDV